MKKFAIMVAVGAALIGGAAYADTIENSYNNTVVVTTSAGAVRYHFNADHTFTMTTPDGNTASGTYTTADGQICMTPAGGAAECNAYDTDKNVGDSWTASGPDGQQVTIALEAGR